jgi:hypothetical protein
MPAPQEFTVERAWKSGTDEKPADWTNNEGGQMTTWEIIFQGDQTVWKAYQNHTKGHPAPVDGAKLSGWKNSDKGTFGIAAPRRPGGGKGGGYGPEDIARMTRSHSQEMAIRFLAATGYLSDQDYDPADKATTGLILNNVLRPLVDWFDKDVQAAKPPVPSNGQGEVTQQDLAAASASPDDADIPF